MENPKRKFELAREQVEAFSESPFRENSFYDLEDGLFSLREIYQSSASDDRRPIIENIVNGVRKKLIAKAGELINVKPIDPFPQALHWLRAMHTLITSDWPIDDEYRLTFKELRRVARISKQYKGHLTKGQRERFFCDESEFVDLF